MARLLKKRIPKRNPMHDGAFLNRPDLTQILNFNLPQPIAAPTSQSSMAGLSTPQITSKLRNEKCSNQISDMSDSDTSSDRRVERQLKKQKRNSSQQTQTVIQEIQDTHGYSTELPVSDTTLIGTVSPRNADER